MPRKHALGVEAPQDGRGGLGAPPNELREPLRRHAAPRVGCLNRNDLVLAETVQDLPGDPVLEGVPLSEGPRDDVVLQRELNLRPVRFAENRVVEQEPLHLGVDAPHALVELPDPAELHEDTRDPGVPRVARLAHVVERDRVGEPARAQDLEPVVVHGDPDVVPRVGVVAVSKIMRSVSRFVKIGQSVRAEATCGG